MTDMEPKTRQELWDERHAAREPIESVEADPSLVALATPMAPGRALDLAAGDGRNAIWLAARGWDVAAVDFSGVALQRAAAAADRAGVKVDWVHEDLLEWRPEPRSADLVILMFLHLPPEERRLVLAGAADAVTPGGRLLIVGHDRSNLGRGVPGPQDPALLYAMDEVVADLAPLVVDDVRQVDHDLGDGRVSTDAVLVASRSRN
ncbi:MAG: class I SAM-dependent methyltransferase [Candidatus Limnocylindrales bacterium]